MFADRPAVVDGAQRYTYAEFWGHAQQLAGMLAAQGVRPGDPFTLLSPNTDVLLEAHYGVPLAGAVPVAPNIRLAAPEIGFILEHSGAKLAIVDTEFRNLLDEASNPEHNTGQPRKRVLPVAAGADGRTPATISDDRV
ncbi:AMP-binding protein [Saccharopolyspora spinosa]|uniref:AMP-binding protein n=1 Tax=Saccharopolyspora spinosa TaxID=60894 RepID=UPI000237B695|nr:AMP-binding protein [Saccharopolyspora spinosa]